MGVKLNNLNIFFLSISAISYFLLYPAYSVLRTIGIPSLYFPVFLYLLLAAIVVLSLINITFLNRIVFNKYTLSLVILFIFILVIQFLAFFRLNDSPDTLSYYLTFTQTNFAYSLLCLLIGLNFNEVIAFFKKSKGLKVFAFVSIIVTYSSLVYSLSLNYITNNQLQILYTIDYLMIGDGLAVSLLTILIMRKGYILKLIGFILLITVMARGVMTSFIIAVSVYFLFKDKITLKKIMLIIGAVLAGVIGIEILIKYQNFVQIYLNQNRAFELFIGISNNGFDYIYEDPSMSERIKVLWLGLNDLNSVWFTGEYMRELAFGNGMIHNWLSFWVSYGIVPFTIFTVIYLLSLFKATILLKKTNDINIQLAFILGIYTLVQIVLFKAYVYPTVWLSLAALTKILDKKEEL